MITVGRRFYDWTKSQAWVPISNRMTFTRVPWGNLLLPWFIRSQRVSDWLIDWFCKYHFKKSVFFDDFMNCINFSCEKFLAKISLMKKILQKKFPFIRNIYNNFWYFIYNIKWFLVLCSKVSNQIKFKKNFSHKYIKKLLTLI